MTLYTSDTKTVVETISYIGDFSDVLVSGETITSQSVTVTVFSGNDLNPSNLLYGGITIHPKSIEQRIRLGIPGNIYSINFIIGTSLGNTYDKVTRLAILPEDTNAIPTFIPFFETTQLYPYQESDNIQGFTLLSSGTLVQLLYAIPPEDIQGRTQLTGGTFVLVLITYNIPQEDIQGSTTLFSGTLVSTNTIPYNNPHEDIKGHTIRSAGTFIGKGISYGILHEDIQGHAILTGGTLM